MSDKKGKQNIKILYENLNAFIVNQLKETRQELISEFLEDLTGCWTWINGKTWTAKSARIKELIQKYEAMLK